MAERVGLEFDAVVTGVMEFGMFAQGIELPAEGLVHVSSLSDDYYRYDRAAHTLSGHRSGNSFRLGDVVRVAVVRSDVERRELDFRIVGRGARPAAGKKLPGPKAARKDAKLGGGKKSVAGSSHPKTHKSKTHKSKKQAKKRPS
jgi:ribonuclease R